MTSEEDSSQTSESSGSHKSGPVCGERLAKARHERGISIREIAKELHLDEPKVRALEENSFEVLGAPVFAKGHMRKYAALVGASIEDVLADYYQLTRSAGAPPVVGPPRKLSRDFSVGPWAAVIVVVVVVVAGAWWWLTLEPAAEPADGEAPTPAPFAADTESDSPEQAIVSLPDEVDVQPIVEDETVAESADTATMDLPSAAETETASVPAAETETTSVEEAVAEAAEPAENNVELALSFGGDCWTEVTDATGRRLFFDLGTDGRTVTLSGVEPLGVLLGDISHVSIQVNGFDYSIPAANRRGNTARLTIYGQ